MNANPMVKTTTGLIVLLLAQAVWAGPSVEQKWETPQTLKTPESVLFHDGILYVANIQGLPTDKDGNGFISTLTLEGKILEMNWVTGLNAPKGMGVLEGFLYVTDIDSVIKVDLKEARIVQKFPVPKAKFLNDIASDGKGRLFISDMAASAIYCLTGDELAFFMPLTWASANGLTVVDGHLFVGTKDALIRIDLATKTPEVWIDGTGAIDGLKPCGDGAFLISDWRGKVAWVHPERPAVVLLDRSKIGMNAADIGYVPEQHLLLVPTFFDNRVFAYEFKN